MRELPFQFSAMVLLADTAAQPAVVTDGMWTQRRKCCSLRGECFSLVLVSQRSLLFSLAGSGFRPRLEILVFDSVMLYGLGIARLDLLLLLLLLLLLMLLQLLLFINYVVRALLQAVSELCLCITTELFQKNGYDLNACNRDILYNNDVINHIIKLIVHSPVGKLVEYNQFFWGLISPPCEQT